MPGLSAGLSLRRYKERDMQVGSFEGHGPGYFRPNDEKLSDAELLKIRKRTRKFIEFIDKAHKDAANSTLHFP